MAGGDPKVSAQAARQIIKRIKAGRASIAGEARRLGCYHATLRKALRAVLPPNEYAKVVRQSPPANITRDAARKAFGLIQSGHSTLSIEAGRVGCSCTTLRNAIYRVVGKDAWESRAPVRRGRQGAKAASTSPRRMRQPVNVSPMVQLPFEENPSGCKRCGLQLLYGTNGMGFAVLECICGWREVVVPKRLPAA